jgi:hypothetical protein
MIRALGTRQVAAQYLMAAPAVFHPTGASPRATVPDDVVVRYT